MNYIEDFLEANRELAGLSEMGKKSCVGFHIRTCQNINNYRLQFWLSYAQRLGYDQNELINIPEEIWLNETKQEDFQFKANAELELAGLTSSEKISRINQHIQLCSLSNNSERLQQWNNLQQGIVATNTQNNLDEETLEADREVAGLSEMGKKSCVGFHIRTCQTINNHRLQFWLNYAQRLGYDPNELVNVPVEIWDNETKQEDFQFKANAELELAGLSLEEKLNQIKTHIQLCSMSKNMERLQQWQSYLDTHLQSKEENHELPSNSFRPR